ncbi:MAG: hypothetical protein COT43_08020 [Candidatus Marinimicrobia bacterium CG08_land_8_20_14_0_20_45_22]|nr:MAG: hypothetical protein COT43_08020 [Candidatus Marinimicrobia bacterium CG08_land_8_20_14_0_20_45_22]
MILTNKISHTIQDSIELKKRLITLTEKLKNEFGVDVCFCEIFGKRWSYVAGNQTIGFPHRRIRLNDKIGLIIGENLINEKIVQSLMEDFK